MRGRLDGTGKAVINNAANDGKTNYTFVELVACPNVSASYLGLKTCDVDFVRRFNEGILPIGASDNGPHDPRYPDPALVIDNACESALLQVRRNVSFHDHFFPKEQPYSLINMLNFAPEAHQFVVKIEQVTGPFYSEIIFYGVVSNASDPEPGAPDFSQPNISVVATRSIMYIQARNLEIGMMAIVFTGMAEVSSCEFTVKEGDETIKGQELGIFQHGGSSHCMVFQPGVDLEFVHHAPWNTVDVDTEKTFQVKSALAVVS